MNAHSAVVVGERSERCHAPSELDWLSDGIVITSRLGTPETTAIVPPRTFTTAMMRSAQGLGARLLLRFRSGGEIPRTATSHRSVS